MAPVVRELAQLPEADVRAMAHYLASFNPPADDARNAEQARSLIAAAERSASVAPDAAQRLFDGACGACHHAGNGPEVFGQNLPLALSSKLHGAQPDNLLRVILEGVREPASRELGFMPAFRDALDDAQVARLAAYLRTRFAPGQPAWRDLEATSARLRAHPSLP
jgi:nicotinate dehydrogenase subunit B